jgi:D-3-phosphoglycerate dehydrogenase
MRKIVVLCGDLNSYHYEIDALKQFADVELIFSSAVSEEDVIADIKDAEVVLFTSTKLNERIINSLEKCKLIIRYGIGYDNVDIEAAANRGIYVCNAPNYGIQDVAEHALSLIFATAKMTVKMTDRVKEGLWGPGMPPFLRLSGKTIGFVGFGNIGKALCKMTNGISMTPIVYDPFVSKETVSEYDAEKVELEELLEKSDYVSLHLPLNEKTRHLFGKNFFTKMKRTAILINTSRGAIVNENELIEALEKKLIAGVGLDVFEEETHPVDARLLNIENAVLTPHVAWNTDVALVAIHEEVGDNVVRYLKGERPHSIVNKL